MVPLDLEQRTTSVDGSILDRPFDFQAFNDLANQSGSRRRSPDSGLIFRELRDYLGLDTPGISDGVITNRNVIDYVREHAASTKRDSRADVRVAPFTLVGVKGSVALYTYFNELDVNVFETEYTPAELGNSA